MPTAESPFVVLNPVAYLDGSVSVRPTRSHRLRESGLGRAHVRILPTDRAVWAVTDFTWEQPVTIAADRTIDDALREMTAAAVHALLVMRADAVTGLITYTDIQALKRSLSEHAAISRYEEIELFDIMTPWERVVTLDWQFLGLARVAELVALFERTSTSHAVIVEYGEQGGTFVRGIASRARLERQLGQSLRP
jgi:CBS domain-containing protein